LTEGAMMYAEGVYENTYVKENGVWKIAVLFWVPTYYVSHEYDYMWLQSAAASTEIPPQRPPTPPMRHWVGSSCLFTTDTRSPEPRRLT
jgi:hypothetical protein